METENELKEKILLKHCTSWYVTNNTNKKKIFSAMQEWAEEYHKQHSENPPVIKSVCDENCVHPYMDIYRKMDYEKCNKCGEVLCEG